MSNSSGKLGLAAILGMTLMFSFGYAVLSQRISYGSARSAPEEAITGNSSELDDLREQISKLEYENELLRIEIKDRTSELDVRTACYDTTREPVWNVRNYQWISYVDGQHYSVDIPIDKNTYDYYTSLDRYYFNKNGNSEDVLNYIDDPVNAAVVDVVIDRFRSLMYDNNWSEARMIREIIAFIQAMPYEYDTVTTGYDEYPRYPVETLYNNCGDCEDTSFLLAAVFKRLGYGCALIQFDNHAAVGVSMTPGSYSGSYYEKDGVYYYYIETTGEGFDIGEIPDDITDSNAYLIVVS